MKISLPVKAKTHIWQWINIYTESLEYVNREKICNYCHKITIHTIKLLQKKYDICYSTYYSITTETLYVLFNSGIVLLKDDLDELIEPLLNLICILVKTNYQLCFCGHSMGAVVSQYAGYLMHINSKYTNYFREKCYVIGSASAKWMLKDSSWTQKQPNVYLFLTVFEIGENILIVDGYQKYGTEELIVYPYTYFLTDKEINHDNIKYADIYSDEGKQLHSWYMYKSMISKYIQN